jgi:hypothetical protein
LFQNIYFILWWVLSKVTSTKELFSTRTKHQIANFMILGLKCLKWYTSKNVRLIFFLTLLEPMLSLFGEWTFIFEWHQLSDKCFWLIWKYIYEMNPFRQNSTLKAHKFKVLLILISVSLRYLKVVALWQLTFLVIVPVERDLICNSYTTLFWF